MSPRRGRLDRDWNLGAPIVEGAATRRRSSRHVPNGTRGCRDRQPSSIGHRRPRRRAACLAVACRRVGPSPILGAHGPDRPPQRHRDPAVPGDAPGDGRGRGRRRRLRRRPHGERPRGTRGGTPRQGGGPVRGVRHDGQPRRPDGPPVARAGDDRRPGAPPRHRRGGRPRRHRRHQHPLARGPARRHRRPGRDRRRLPRPDRPARADHRPGDDREHPRPFDGPAADRRLHPRGRRDRARQGRPAAHRRGPLLERGRRPGPPRRRTSPTPPTP